MAKSECTDSQIAEVGAHESIETTLGYQHPDDLTRKAVEIKILLDRINF
jgi:hypothetical protein